MSLCKKTTCKENPDCSLVTAPYKGEWDGIYDLFVALWNKYDSLKA